jgi:hypothetical protein
MDQAMDEHQAPVAPRENSHPSHVLWVELGTRIATQRLHYRSGDEETAVGSIDRLFSLTRELMEKHPADAEFQILALTLLNSVLRPCTARWHGWMTEDADFRNKDGKLQLKFRDEWVRRQFRRELRALQPRLVGFLKAFDALRIGGMPEKWWTTPDDSQLQDLGKEIAEQAKVGLGKPLAAGIADQVRFGAMVEEDRKKLVDRINRAEHAEIRRRRGNPGDEPVMNATALAFSGGGIRSATFCLGITQVLARRKLLAEFDYLSTVSGGGYLGSFLSAHLGTGDRELPPSEEPVGETFEQKAERERNDEKAEIAARLQTTFTPGPDQREPRALRHLRNRSRYLADGGFSRKLAGIGIVLLGAMFNLLIVLPLPLIGALLTFLLWQTNLLGHRDWVDNESHWLPRWDAPWSIALWIVLGGTAVWSLAYPSIRARSQKSVRSKGSSKSLEGWEKGFVLALFATALLLACWMLPVGFRIYHLLKTAEIGGYFDAFRGRLESLAGVFGLSLTVALCALASKLKLRSKSGSWITTLAVLSGPLFYLFVYFGVGHRLMFETGAGRWPWHWVLLATLLITLWAWWFVDVNTYSPHGYYRDRLSECYLRARRNLSGGDYDLAHVDGLRLTQLNQCAAAPYHLINATVNLPNSEDREVRGRNADFFLFSKHYCGGPLCGYHPTNELEAADPHLDLGTAMAISGAAASSNMGWQTNNRLRLVMTLANVRLGYWLRNPNPAIANARKLRGPGPLYLVREMFSRGMDEKQKYLNLSDGGHHENLAAYELLRRRCKFIVCVDGGMEPDMQCVDLIRLERYAAIDLGIRMHYDLTDLMLQANGFGRAYGVLVKIDYNPPVNESERQSRQPGDSEWGWMLYIKLAMIGYGPGYVMDYKRTEPGFPHQSTNDQIYDEAQFEAYRALGEAAAESFFSEELIGNQQPKDIETWFKALAGALLPDNDEAFRAKTEHAEAKAEVELRGLPQVP